MTNPTWVKYSVKDGLIIGLPAIVLVVLLMGLAIVYMEPAPPNHLTISTGDDQSDLDFYAKQYQSFLKDEGVKLEIRNSPGPMENLRRLEDDTAHVDAAFVQDGLGSADAQPDISSLGSLYYEPIWIFYHGPKTLTHISQLEGKHISVGRIGHGSQVIAQRLLKLSGVDLHEAKFVNMNSTQSLAALEKGEIDAAIFMLPADDPVVKRLALHQGIKLMSVEQAEAISRKDAAFHHLILPRGALDLNGDVPSEDIDVVASTATLLIRDDLHPALAFLLLKAASQVHKWPGIFENRGEFPAAKDDVFPLSDDAVQFYKSGGPFWQRYLPYWLAAWLDRFVLLVIPVMALVLPLLRWIPQMYRWRLRQKIYQRYGELKFLEMQIHGTSSKEQLADYAKQLDTIEERVDKMKMPRTFADYIYSLKGHIQFVRDRLTKADARAET